MLKHYKLKLSDLTIEPKIGLKDYSFLFGKGITIKSLLINQDVINGIKSGRTPSKFNEEYWNGEYDFLTMQDVDTLMFGLKENCEDKITDTALDENNNLYQAETGSLIISNAMTVGLTFFTDRPIYLNQNVFNLNFDETKVNKKFLLWYFNLHLRPIFDNLFSSKYLSKDELGRIKIPNLPLSTQNEIVSKIEPIEQKIKELKSQIKDQKDVINLVFAKDFGFDENLANEFGKGMTALTQSLQDRKLKINTIKLDELVKSEIVRVSTRFHNEPTKKLMEFLGTLKTIQIKDIISEPAHRGASPSYDENGEIPVIKTGHLKNGYIEISQDEFVSQEFYDKNIRSQVNFGDILIASTGKGSLGKIDIVENDEIDLVCDSHVSIIRVNEKKYNSLFLTYFLRSILGIFQVERDYTGATNQIELGASEIENFKIPDISLPVQQKIVDEIKLELDKQEKIKKDIEKERSKIDELIEESIKNI